MAITKVIPILTGNATVTPVVDSSVGAATATLGTTTSPLNLNNAGDSQTISATWNVQGTASPGGVNSSWLLINGANATSTLQDAFGVSTNLVISAGTNNTGSSRTATITLRNSNTRLTGIVDQVITINQA